MSFGEQTQVTGATIKSRWLHLQVTNAKGERVLIDASCIENTVKSLLNVHRIDPKECRFITDILQKKQVILSREDISALNFSAVLEVLPPMKRKHKKGPKKRR